MTPPTTTRAGRRIAALATAGVAAATLGGVALAVPAHAQGPATPAASTPSTTYTSPASMAFDYQQGGVQAHVVITRAADTFYRVQITNGRTTSAAPVTIPVGVTSGLMAATRTYPMAAGNGTMNVTDKAATFQFNKAYLEHYHAPFTFAGEWDVLVTTAQTSTQTITVGGHIFMIGVHAPALSGDASGAGQRNMVKRSFELERTTLRSDAAARFFFTGDNDGGETYGELKALYKSPKYKRDYAQSYIFRTVSVPDNATRAEVDAAINKVLPRGWDPITTNAHQNLSIHAALVVTTANEVQTSKGARPLPGGLAWGKHHNIPEIYIGSSGQRHI